MPGGLDFMGAAIFRASVVVAGMAAIAAPMASAAKTAAARHAATSITSAATTAANGICATDFDGIHLKIEGDKVVDFVRGRISLDGVDVTDGEEVVDLRKARE